MLSPENPCNLQAFLVPMVSVDKKMGKKQLYPMLRLFKGYRVLVLGNREFHSIKLADWLHSKGISFVLRQKQGTYIRQDNQ